MCASNENLILDRGASLSVEYELSSPTYSFCEVVEQRLATYESASITLAATGLNDKR